MKIFMKTVLKAPYPTILKAQYPTFCKRKAEWVK